MIDESENCKSCGKRFILHLGIIGTCAHLRESIRRLTEAHKRLQLTGNAGLIDDISDFLSEVES